MKDYQFHLMLGTALQVANLIFFGLISSDNVYLLNEFAFTGTLVPNIISYYFLVLGTLLYYKRIRT